MKVSDDRIEIRSGGGCVSLLGLPFLLAGCGVIVATVSGAFDGPPAVGIIFGCVFALVGTLIVFGRAGFEIDAKSRTYRKWYRLLMLTKETTGTLDGFGRVAIDREVRHSKNSTYTVYPIRLVGQEGKLDIEESRDADKARSDAEAIAKTLAMPLADRTGSEEVVRDAEHLDESLRERRRRTGEAPSELPEPPEGMKTQFHTEGKEMIMEIPPAGFTPGALLCLLPAVIVPTFVVLFFLRPMLRDFEKMPKPFLFIFVGFLGVFFILLPICVGVGMFLRVMRTRYTVSVSPKRLHVLTQGVFLSRSSQIPADDLEELHVAKLHGRQNSPMAKADIVARSDQTTIKFGGHLSAPEKEWIKAVMEQVLTA